MTRLSPRFIAMVLWLPFAACSTSPGQDADASQTAYLMQYLEGSFRLRPMDATRLGDHRFDRLAPPSYASHRPVAAQAVGPAPRCEPIGQFT